MTGVFDVVPDAGPIKDTEHFLDFIVKIAPVEFSIFVEDLVSFLKTATQEKVKNLELLTLLIETNSKLLEKYRSQESTVDLEKKLKILTALKEIGLENIRKNLQDPQDGNIRAGILQKLLVDLSSDEPLDVAKLRQYLSANMLAEAREHIKQIEDEAKKIPPVTYHVVFSPLYDQATKDNINIYPQSFSSYKEATDFIFKMPGKHKVGKTNYATQACIYSVVEMQTQEADAFSDSTKDTISKVLSSQPATWPKNLNSVSKIADRNAKSTCPEKIQEDRQYNPEGANGVTRALNQLNHMIKRLENVSVIWKILEKFTKQPNLRDQKIQALSDVKDKLYLELDKINKKTTSLREVLENMLDKTPQNSTRTMRQLLETHRISSNSAGSTRTMDDFNEMLNATRPPDDSEDRLDASLTSP